MQTHLINNRKLDKQFEKITENQQIIRIFTSPIRSDNYQILVTAFF